MLLDGKGSICLCLGLVLLSSASTILLVTPLFEYGHAKKVDLEQGDKLTVRLEIDDPTSVHELSLRARTAEGSDPFEESYSRIPITVEVRDKGKVVGSESMTAHLENSFEKFDIDFANDPKVSGTFSAVISFDFPEDNEVNPKIRVDTDEIEVIDNKENDLDIVRTTAEN